MAMTEFRSENPQTDSALCPGLPWVARGAETSHGRGRWFNPSRAHHKIKSLRQIKTERACADEQICAAAAPQLRAAASTPIREKLAAIGKALQYPIECLDHIADARVKQHLLARSAAVAALEQVILPEPLSFALALDRFWEAERERCEKIVRGVLFKEHYRQWPAITGTGEDAGSRGNDSELTQWCDRLADLIRNGDPT